MLYEVITKLCVSSTKSMTGHLLGGAGAFEAMVLAKVVAEDKIPPTINLDNPDEGMDLDYVPRITSYNVCYTKLLRLQLANIKIPGFLIRRI